MEGQQGAGYEIKIGDELATLWAEIRCSKRYFSLGRLS